MATSSAKPEMAAGATERNMPLFIKQPRALSLESHGKSGIKRTAGFAFAKDTNSVPLTSVEFFEAARSFPIVFSSSEPVAPVAILGLEQDNMFLEKNDEWKAGHYIPGYIRQYPFLLYKNSANDEMVLCIDEASAAFAKTSPDMSFYTDDGKPAEFSQKALEFCAAYYQQHQGTLEFVKALKENDLLTARQTTVTLPDGNKVNLTGFLAIDEAKYTNLPDAVYLDWRKKGWTLLVDAILISTINWKYLAQMTVDKKVK
ncbi:MAG: SapC family protein [Rickettsiales bacterium]